VTGAVATVIFLIAALATMAAALVIPLTLGVIAGVFLIGTVILAVKIGADNKRDKVLGEGRREFLVQITNAPKLNLLELLAEGKEQVKQRFTCLGMNEECAGKIALVYEQVKEEQPIWLAFKNNDDVNMGDFRKIIKRDLLLIACEGKSKEEMLQAEIKAYFKSEDACTNIQSANNELGKYYAGVKGLWKVTKAHFSSANNKNTPSEAQ
jgi:hypothetical protein